MQYFSKIKKVTGRYYVTFFKKNEEFTFQLHQYTNDFGSLKQATKFARKKVTDYRKISNQPTFNREIYKMEASGLIAVENIVQNVNIVGQYILYLNGGLKYDGELEFIFKILKEGENV